MLLWRLILWGDKMSLNGPHLTGICLNLLARWDLAIIRGQASAVTKCHSKVTETKAS